MRLKAEFIFQKGVNRMVCEEKPQVPEEPQAAPTEEPQETPSEESPAAPAEPAESQYLFLGRELDEHSNSLPLLQQVAYDSVWVRCLRANPYLEMVQNVGGTKL